MERIRVARALVGLPATFEKLAEGEVSWSAVRELCRVVTPETEGEWLGACANLRVRDIERMVSGRRPGDLPSTPADESARRHVVRYEVLGSTFGVVRKAQDEHRRRTGASLGDDAFILAMAQAYLAQEVAGASASRAPAQVTVTLCPACRKGTTDAGGEPVVLTPSELEKHCCDARVEPTARTEPVIAPGHSATKSRVGRGELSLTRVDPIAQPVQPSPELLAEIERRAAKSRATELPKKIRDLVIQRHHGQCAVPGCTNTACLHAHHVDPRADGGSHDPDRLIPLCGTHHRAVHDGRLLITGAWSSGFRFQHADGTPYGTRELPDPRKSEAAKVAYDVLWRSGFRQTEAKQAVDAIRDRIEPAMSIEDVVKMAFQATLSLPAMRRVSRVRD
jgi:hypothetical protein